VVHGGVRDKRGVCVDGGIECSLGDNRTKGVATAGRRPTTEHTCMSKNSAELGGASSPHAPAHCSASMLAGVMVLTLRSGNSGWSTDRVGGWTEEVLGRGEGGLRVC
jgi:hypothetical protein